MNTFAIVAEGPTDQYVIENILAGFYGAGADGDEVEANFLQPPPGAIGGWEKVLNYCASDEFVGAFQFNHYVVVHIDADCCEEKNYDVERSTAPATMITRVESRLSGKIGERVWHQYRHRIIFAIAVDSIECWLLPLYADRQQNRTLHCLPALDRALIKKDMAPASGKLPPYFAQLSADYSKHRILMQKASKNPSLKIFVENLKQHPLPNDIP